MRPVPVLALVPLLALAAAAPASAATYCVQDADCPAGAITQPTIEAAASAASADDGADTVRVGPGRFALSAPVALQGSDVLAGAGTGMTTLTGALQTAGAVAVRDLTVALRADQTSGIAADGGSLERVAIDGSAATSPSARGLSGSRRVVFAGGSVVMGAGTGVVGDGIGAPEVQDASITAPVGVKASYYGVTLRRTRVTATTGVLAPDGAVRLDAVVIALVGEKPVGILVGPGEVTPFPASVRHTTIAGSGAAGSVGIAARARCEFQAATLTVETTAVQGVATDLERSSACPDPRVQPAAANLTVTRSAYEPSKVVSSGAGTGRFEAPVATDLGLDADLVPLPGSALVDAGDPAEAAATDGRGLTRPVDGDGDGSAVADVGAFELQPPAPVTPVGPAAPAPGPDGGGVLGDTGARVAPTRLRVRAVAYRANRPGRYEVRARLGFPDGANPAGAGATLTVFVRGKRAGRLRTTMDRRGHADFKLRLRKGTRRSQVRLQVRFAGNDALTARTSARVTLR